MTLNTFFIKKKKKKICLKKYCFEYSSATNDAKKMLVGVVSLIHSPEFQQKRSHDHHHI